MANVTNLLQSLSLDSKNGRNTKFKKSISIRDRALKENNFTNGNCINGLKQSFQKVVNNDKVNSKNEIKDISDVNNKKKALSSNPEDCEVLESLIEDVIESLDVVCEDNTTDEEKDIHKIKKDGNRKYFNNFNGKINNEQCISKSNGVKHSKNYHNVNFNSSNNPDIWFKNGDLIDKTYSLHNGSGDSINNQLDNHNVNVYPAQLKVAIKHMDILPPRFLRRLQASALDEELVGAAGDNSGFDFFNSENGREKLRGTLLNENKKPPNNLNKDTYSNGFNCAYNNSVYSQNEMYKYNFNEQQFPVNGSRFVPYNKSDAFYNASLIGSQNPLIPNGNNSIQEYGNEKIYSNNLSYCKQILNCSEVEEYLTQANRKSNNANNDIIKLENLKNDIDETEEINSINPVFSDYSQNIFQNSGIISPPVAIQYFSNYSTPPIPYSPNSNSIIPNTFMLQQTMVSETGELIPINVIMDGAYAPTYLPENSVPYMPYYAPIGPYCYEEYPANSNWSSEYEDFDGSFLNPTYYLLQDFTNESMNQFEQEVLNSINCGYPVLMVIIGSYDDNFLTLINNLQNTCQCSRIKLNNNSKDIISYEDIKKWNLLQTKEAILSAQALIIIEIFSQNLNDYEDYLVLSQSHGYKLFILEGVKQIDIIETNEECKVNGHCEQLNDNVSLKSYESTQPLNVSLTSPSEMNEISSHQ